MNTKEKFIASELFREVLGLHCNRLSIRLHPQNIQDLADIADLDIRINTDGKPYIMMKLGMHTDFTEVYYESNILWADGKWSLVTDAAFCEKCTYTSSLTIEILENGAEVFVGDDKKVRGTIKDRGLSDFKFLSYLVAVEGQVDRWFAYGDLHEIKQSFGTLDGVTWYETTFLHTRSTGVNVFEINGEHVDEHFIATPRYSLGQSIANAIQITHASERIKDIVLKNGVVCYRTDTYSVAEPQAVHSEEYIMGERLYLRAQFNNPQILEKLGKTAIITLIQENGDLRTLRQLLSTDMTSLCQDALKYVRGDKNVH